MERPGGGDRRQRPAQPLDRVRLRRPRRARRGGAAAGRGRDRPRRSTRSRCARNLYAPELPDPDLLIRTSGELRISNFLLWQLAYSRARLRGHALARLRPPRARGRARGVRAAPPPLRRPVSAHELVLVADPGGGRRAAARARRRLARRLVAVRCSPSSPRSLALHEFFWIARPLRPLVLAGYTGAMLALLGAWLGGPVWMRRLPGRRSPLAFLLKGVSQTRQSLTVAVATTVLGAAWVGLGLAHILLLRDRPAEDGRLAVFTVLLAVFAADTIAYFAGRLVGRHRLAPVISPGQDVGGLRRRRRSPRCSCRSSRSTTRTSSTSGSRSCSAR